LDGVELRFLAKKYGTPLFVFSESRIKEVITWINKLCNKYLEKNRLFYALKANSNIHILKIFEENGIGAETVSLGEIFKAIYAGYKPQDIIFNGPGKGYEGLKAAVKLNLHCINIDSEYEYQIIHKIAKNIKSIVNLGVRVVPEVEAQVIKTGSSWTKFGLELDEAEVVYEEIFKSEELNPVGIHMHLGSQILDAKTWYRGINKILKFIKQLRKKGIILQHVNLGGGLPVNYAETPIDLQLDLPDKFKPSLDEEEFFKQVKYLLDKFRMSGLNIYFEFGRRMIADAGILLTKVVNIKERSNGDRWIILDVGFNTLLSSTLYKWYYPLLNISKISDEHMDEYRVAGPLCDTDDVFHDLEGEKIGHPTLPTYRKLPKNTSPGDIMMFMHVGAYTFEEASNYNSIPRPAIILIRENGDIKVIRRRETLIDLIALELNLREGGSRII